MLESISSSTAKIVPSCTVHKARTCVLFASRGCRARKMCASCIRRCSTPVRCPLLLSFLAQIVCLRDLSFLLAHSPSVELQPHTIATKVSAWAVSIVLGESAALPRSPALSLFSPNTACFIYGSNSSPTRSAARSDSPPLLRFSQESFGFANAKMKNSERGWNEPTTLSRISSFIFWNSLLGNLGLFDADSGLGLVGSSSLGGFGGSLRSCGGGFSFEGR